MADREHEVGAVHGVKVKGLDAVLRQLLHLAQWRTEGRLTVTALANTSSIKTLRPSESAHGQSVVTR